MFLQRGDKWKKNRIKYVLCAARTVRVKRDFSSVNVLMKLLFADLKSLLWEQKCLMIKSIFVLLYSRPKPCQHKRPTRLSPHFLNFVYFCELISNIWSQNVVFFLPKCVREKQPQNAEYNHLKKASLGALRHTADKGFQAKPQETHPCPKKQNPTLCHLMMKLPQMTASK